MIEATESTFDQMVRTAGSVLVEFTSSNCGPCQLMRKSLESISSITVLQVDVKRCPAITNRFSITMVPTLVLIQNGKDVRRHTGIMTLQAIQQFIS